MWNRQREADKARELLAEVGEADAAPNRNPPAAELVAEDVDVAAEPIDVPATAAE
jgi:ATP-binding cassette subfamily B protein